MDPFRAARVQVLDVAARRAWLPALAVALLTPLAVAGEWAAWALGAAFSASAFLVALPLSAAGVLLAVRVAESPGWAPLLDLLRGSNPRPQAAFLYAPGVVLAVAGAALWAGARGAREVLEGWPGGLALLALPAIAAILGALPLPALARHGWFRAGPIVADIDARHGALVERDEALRVYLEWAVRWLPRASRPWALDDLRHGWRARRGWITGAWLGGALGALAGWTSDPAGPGRAAAVATAAALVAAAVGVLLSSDQPEFLAAWLPDGGLARRMARLGVVWAWGQGAILPAAAVVAVRGGVREALALLALAEVAALGGAALAVACGAWRERGLVLYGPVAAVAALLAATWATAP